MAKRNKKDKSLQTDWRIQGQEDYLKGIKLYHKQYKAYSKEWDHDHCEFCYEKFSEKDDGLKSGYTTADNYYRNCETCYKEFK